MSNLVIDDLRIQRSAKPDHRKGREGRKGKRKFNLLEVPLRVFRCCTALAVLTLVLKACVMEMIAISIQRNLYHRKGRERRKGKRKFNFLEFPLRSLRPLRYSFCWLLIAGCYL